MTAGIDFMMAINPDARNVSALEPNRSKFQTNQQVIFVLYLLTALRAFSFKSIQLIKYMTYS